ncbi:MAG: O-antigen ligase family protein [Patescibacteria group bacterium]
MKRIGLLGVYEWGLLAVLLLIVLHAPFSVAVGSWLPDYATIIKAWKEIVLTVLATIAVASVTRRRAWPIVLRNGLIQLSLAFIVLHVVLAAVLGGDQQSVVAGLMIDLRFIVMFILMYVLVLLRPESIKRVLAVVAAGAVIVLGFGLLQITLLPDDVLRGIGYSRQTITPFTTIDSNPEYVRINSTLRGPNPLGAIAVVYAALASAYLLKRTRGADMRRIAVVAGGLVAAGAVVFASYSRSAYIALGAALGLTIVMTKKVSRSFVLAGMAVFALLIVGLVLVSTTDWYSNVILHEDPESTVVSKSNDGHIESFETGAYRAVTQPVGAGVGSTGSASLYDDDQANDAIIENYYFFVAHESGWLGLTLFIALFAGVLIELWRRRSGWPALGLFASGIGLALIGMLLPVWADETVALIWWGVAGALIAPTSGIIRSSNAKRARK